MDFEPRPMQEPNYAWDVVDIDLFIRVARLSILSPAFSMWAPILFLSQGYHPESTPYRAALAYFLVTFSLWIVPWTSNVWTNRSWKGGITGVLAGRRVDWGEQVVLITGGASGVGRLLAETLAVRHVSVVVLDKEKYNSDWNEVYYYECDVSDPKAIEEAAVKIREEVGDPTIIVNNAGVVQGKNILDLTEEEVKETFDVNTLAHFRILKIFLPDMIKKNQGHVVTVASVFGFVGCAQLADYCASKHALIGLHESLRHELRTRYNAPSIRTSLVVPGQIRTKLFATVAPHSRLVSFLCPTVSPHEVAKKIISALDCDEGREIYLPFYTGFAWLFRGMPSWLGDAAHWFTGANDSMRPFKKSGKSA